MKYYTSYAHHAKDGFIHKTRLFTGMAFASQAEATQYAVKEADKRDLEWHALVTEPDVAECSEKSDSTAPE